MRILQSLVIACSMYSKIPMPQVDWNEKNMKYAMCFFPVIGAVIGAAQYVVGNYLLQCDVGNIFFAAVMTLIPVFITGGIHLDGFMDTMDALGSYGDKEKKLAILKDSNSGAFAVLGMGCYFVWSLGMWSEVTRDMLPVIAGIYVISRALSGLSVVTFRAARNSGLAKNFQDRAQKKTVTIIMILVLCGASAYLLWQDLKMGIAAMCAAVIMFTYYYLVSYKQFGGITGDLAGFFLQMNELLMVTFIVVVGMIK